MTTSVDNYYDPGEIYVSKAVNDHIKTLGFTNFYDILKEKDKLKLLDLIDGHVLINFKRLVKYINTEGTISPFGYYVNTPSKISIELKPHQKRTVYEMLARENGKYRYSSGHNVNLLCDNVGSGKSLCILALIAEQPQANVKSDVFYSSKTTYNMTNYPHGYNWYGSKYNLQCTINFHSTAIELKSNLIVVPHNIFLQWQKYIMSYTDLKCYYIPNKKAYIAFCKSKESVIKISNEYDIILVKSTMYKKMYYCLNTAILGSTDPSRDASTKIENISATKDLTMKMRNEMLHTRTKFMTSYRDFMSMSEHELTSAECFELKQSFKEIQDKLNDLTNSYDWNEIGKHTDAKVTPWTNSIKSYYFQRVIVDEVDSIKVPAFPYIHSKQIWYISSSINNLIYPYGSRQYNSQTGTYKTISSGISGTGYLKEILANVFRNTSWSSNNIKLDTFRGLFSIVRSNNSFLQNSIQIPDPIINMIECYTPPHLYAIKNAVDKEVLKAFNAGDTQKAIDMLGCKGGSEKELVDQITQKLIDKKTLLLEKITSKKAQITNDTIRAGNLQILLSNTDCDALSMSLFDSELTSTKKRTKNNKLTIKVSMEQISSLEAKISGIKERLGNVEAKKCPICCDSFTDPSITPCCNNVFCIECITMALATNSVCPLCREPIQIKDVNIIINSLDGCYDQKTPNSEQLKGKLENLISLVKSKSDKRIMIFSEYDATLNLIKDQLESLDIKYSKVKGAGSTIQNIIARFKSGDYQVILLNAKYFGAGLNLQFTDEIIIYHRMSKDLETQVIGRAQRLGRKSPLIINYMCYDNEYS